MSETPQTNETSGSTSELERLLMGTITQQQAEEIFAMGKEAVVCALLNLYARCVAANNANAQGQPSPSTPSGASPPYLKQKKKQKGKQGRPVNHKGEHRNVPEPDKTVSLHLQLCPECGGPLSECQAKSTRRQRTVEDIPEGIKAETTRYEMSTYWCPHCKKTFTPKVPDALPGHTIGNRLLTLTAWLHYFSGNTLSRVIELFNYHLSIKLTPGGLIHSWSCLGEIFKPWYKEIKAECFKSGVLHGDESGWRVNGQTEWLWCFATQKETYYFIVPSRGQPAVHEFFKEFYDGVLVTDFWGPYEQVACTGMQKCLVHLLREFKRIEKYKDTSEDWPAFRKKLHRIIMDAITLWRDKRESLDVEVYSRRCDLVESRLDTLLEQEYTNPEAQRLVKRLRKHRHALFTFLYRTDVPFDNNHAERSIRPTVLIRKNSYGNRSDDGAETQSILMSIFQTLKQRGVSPTDVLGYALRQYCLTGIVPSLAESTQSTK